MLDVAAASALTLSPCSSRLLRVWLTSLGPVLGVDELAALLVLLGVGLGVGLHLLDLVGREPARVLDPDVGLLAGALVDRGDLQDAVGVDGELDLDLRHAARRGRMPVELELPERAVVLGELALALQDVDLTLGWLSAAVEKVSFLLVGMVVLRSMSLVITPPSVSTPSAQRGDVEQQDVLDVAREHAALDRRADRDDLVGVDALVGLLAEDLLAHLLDLRDAGRAADEDDLVDLARVEPGVLDRLSAGLAEALEQVVAELLELAAGDLDLRCLGPFWSAVMNGRLTVVCCLAELLLGLLGGLLETLHRHRVCVRSMPSLLLELLGEEVDEAPGPSRRRRGGCRRWSRAPRRRRRRRRGSRCRTCRRRGRRPRSSRSCPCRARRRGRPRWAR
jgi:hypothetical protein